MSLVKETHFQASIYLLKYSKETPGQGIKYAQNEQQNHQNNVNDNFLVSTSQTLGTSRSPSIPMLTSNIYLPLDCQKTHITNKKSINKNSNFLKKTDMLKLTKYSKK